jgi:hypothetical protein
MNKNAIEKVKSSGVALIDKKSLETGLKSLAKAVGSMTKDTSGEVLAAIGSMVKLAEEYEKMAKGFVKELLIKEGKVVTEAGTRRLSAGGYVLEIQPVSTGLDHAKVEAMLRSKSIDPISGMDVEMKFKVNEGKLADLLKRKKLTNEELENCKKDESYKVMPAKKEE